MRTMLLTGNDPTAASQHGRCIYIEQSQMGSTSYGGNDLVTMTRTTTPDEIGINRGTRGRVGVVGFL